MGRVVKFGFGETVVVPAVKRPLPLETSGVGVVVSGLLTLSFRGQKEPAVIGSTVAGIGYTATCATENETCDIL